MRGAVNTWSKEGIDSFIGVINSVIVMSKRGSERKHVGVAEAAAGEGEQQAVNLEMALRGLSELRSWMVIGESAGSP